MPRSIDQDEHLDRMLARVATLRAALDGEIGGLTPDQLRWRPPSGGWGVGECVRHLNVINAPYLERIEGALDEAERRGGPRTDGVFRWGRFGRWFASAAGAEGKRKVRTRKEFDPPVEEVRPDEVEHLRAQQERLERLVERARPFDLARLRVVSPVARIFRFRLGDTFDLITGHQLRHLDQARRVMREERFPTGTRG